MLLSRLKMNIYFTMTRSGFVRPFGGPFWGLMLRQVESLLVFTCGFSMSFCFIFSIGYGCVNSFSSILVYLLLFKHFVLADAPPSQLHWLWLNRSDCEPMVVRFRVRFGFISYGSTRGDNWIALSLAIFYYNRFGITRLSDLSNVNNDLLL